MENNITCLETLNNSLLYGSEPIITFIFIDKPTSDWKIGHYWRFKYPDYISFYLSYDGPYYSTLNIIYNMLKTCLDNHNMKLLIFSEFTPEQIHNIHADSYYFIKTYLSTYIMFPSKGFRYIEKNKF